MKPPLEHFLRTPLALCRLFCHSVKMQPHKLMRIFVDGTIVLIGMCAENMLIRFSLGTGKKGIRSCSNNRQNSTN